MHQMQSQRQADKERLAVCIGRDSRPSGQMIYSAVAGGLCSVGVDVVDLGVVSTPGVGIMLRRLGCAGGVVITASHNPVEYNGIKLLPTYHPAYLLRNPDKKREVWEDMQMLMKEYRYED